MRALVESICRGKDDCVRELFEAFGSLREIEQRLVSRSVAIAAGSSLPLITSLDDVALQKIVMTMVETLRELGYDIDRAVIERVITGALEPNDNESSFVSLVLRRFLYKSLKSSNHPVFQTPWEGSICPICGLVPIAAVRGEGQSLVYRCLCGFAWTSSSMTCPQCRSSDVSVGRAGDLGLYRCRNCGHVMVVATEEQVGGEEGDFFPLAAALLLSSAQGSGEGRSAGGGI
ncbi:MAG: formate dehydrogenase accessory protein FdhE [Acidilobaceae archaeon]|nr:formate dehydrogenase accessory protein FdhE [Acidilobaceae archaeon]MCX8166075.1 formate dehydrogenase accessory protein FdhE [Acidilobaceae archaeon]MDW7974718.1 formate dehydrogenase accessory protein FdhE [Sulfolobales archaeon]